jgi:cytochrome P450 family 138
VGELERILPGFIDRGARMAVFGRPFQRDLGPLSPWARFLKARQRVDHHLDALIARARAEEPRQDVLSLLVHAGMQDAAIRDQLITLLAAGHETTASQLAWAIERARRHPEVLERLPEQSYRDAFIREVQRQRPVVSFAARTTTGPYELGEHVLPPGVRVGLAAALTHFDPRLFDEPHRFRPERFLEAKPDTYSWIPFGGGVRRCIGAAFAHMEMDVVLRTLLERVELLAAPDEPGEGWRFRGVTHVPARGGRAVFV